MNEENDLERLRRQVEKSKILVQQSELKVEELEASMREIYNFKDRLVIFPRNRKGKLPTQNVGYVRGRISFECRLESARHYAFFP